MQKSSKAVGRITQQSGCIYVPADVSKENDVKKIIQEAKARFGHIDGIIHSAGVIHDAFILNKTSEQIKDVLSSKILGTKNLDELTQLEPLDFFILFSSIAAIFGNMGQCDYAYANGYMDGFAEEREKLRTINKRQGKTISINWPLWKEGGLTLDSSAEQSLKDTLGLIPLSTNAVSFALQNVTPTPSSIDSITWN